MQEATITSRFEERLLQADAMTRRAKEVMDKLRFEAEENKTALEVERAGKARELEVCRSSYINLMETMTREQKTELLAMQSQLESAQLEVNEKSTQVELLKISIQTAKEELDRKNDEIREEVEAEVAKEVRRQKSLEEIRCRELTDKEAAFQAAAEQIKQDQLEGKSKLDKQQRALWRFEDELLQREKALNQSKQQVDQAQQTLTAELDTLNARTQAFSERTDIFTQQLTQMEQERAHLATEKTNFAIEQETAANSLGDLERDLQQKLESVQNARREVDQNASALQQEREALESIQSTLQVTKETLLQQEQSLAAKEQQLLTDAQEKVTAFAAAAALSAELESRLVEVERTKEELRQRESVLQKQEEAVAHEQNSTYSHGAARTRDQGSVLFVRCKLFDAELVDILEKEKLVAQREEELARGAAELKTAEKQTSLQCEKLKIELQTLRSENEEYERTITALRNKESQQECRQENTEQATMKSATAEQKTLKHGSKDKKKMHENKKTHEDEPKMHENSTKHAKNVSGTETNEKEPAEDLGKPSSAAEKPQVLTERHSDATEVQVQQHTAAEFYDEIEVESGAFSETSAPASAEGALSVKNATPIETAPCVCSAQLARLQIENASFLWMAEQLHTTYKKYSEQFCDKTCDNLRETNIVTQVDALLARKKALINDLKNKLNEQISQNRDQQTHFEHELRSGAETIQKSERLLIEERAANTDIIRRLNIEITRMKEETSKMKEQKMREDARICANCTAFEDRYKELEKKCKDYLEEAESEFNQTPGWMKKILGLGSEYSPPFTI